ncbi:MAG: ribosome recycling factor [Candidatus Aphodocola sp.]|jgi:ribosome recycling factor
MTDEILLEAEDKMQKAIEVMENRFLNVRAGRANPRILDKVMPEYYGTPTPLIQLANISVPEARKIVIKPFDRNSIGAIEKAIFEADLGLTPNNNGETVMLIIPELTEERRKEYVKEAKTIAEEGKVALRNIRQEANSSIKKIEELPEDEGKRAQEEVQDLINKYNKIVDEKLKTKEDELMSI